MVEDDGNSTVEVSFIVVEVQWILSLVITDSGLLHRVPSTVVVTIVVSTAVVVPVLGHPFGVVGPRLYLKQLDSL